MEISVMLTASLGDFQKAIEYNEKLLKIALEIGDRVGEGGAYGNLGIAYRPHWVTSEKPLSIIEKAVENFDSNR